VVIAADAHRPAGLSPCARPFHGAPDRTARGAAPPAAKQAGQIPASYTEGQGTIVSGMGAN
jgi:hypothetical protein